MSLEYCSPEERPSEVLERVLDKGIQVRVSERFGRPAGWLISMESVVVVLSGETLLTHPASPLPVTAPSPAQRLVA